MTMFTEGRLQAYERMMQQISRRNRGDSRDDGYDRKTNAGKRFNGRKTAKGGDRDGSDPGTKK